MSKTLVALLNTSGKVGLLVAAIAFLRDADQASNNVEIDSLFIHGGFGTLHPETLDTLEKLRSQSSKTIGIIGHLDSLKERIVIQIQWKRNGEG